MAWGKLKVHNLDEVVHRLAFLRKKQINKDKKEADLQLLIGDKVFATDCRIPAWRPLFPFHTNNPFISLALVVWEREKRLPGCP